MPKKRNKKPKKYFSDSQGHYVWETYFVRGKQRRSKVRVTVINGQIIEDMDSWLLANAGDLDLHALERWDLIETRRLEDETSESNTTNMKPSPVTLRLDIEALELAFEFAQNHDSLDIGIPCYAYIDLTTGKVLNGEDDDEEEGFGEETQARKRLFLPWDLFEDLHWGSLDDFIATLDDGPMRSRLAQATRGKGSFRRFKQIVYGEGGVELQHRWEWFEICRKRRCIEDWLHSEGIIPEWGIDIYAPPPLPDKRCDLLCAVLAFVQAARREPGVFRIALIGSLTTPKAIPNDVDLLIGVEDGVPLDGLARLARRLTGATMATGDGCGADVFLHNQNHQYIGRLCKWKQCAPGIRASCKADHCGKRHFLHDDLRVLKLSPTVIEEAPLELWPEVKARTAVPLDVRNLLMMKLENI